MNQLILPTFADPLFMEIYFRNYHKYKQKYIDRLIIIICPTHAICDAYIEYEYLYHKYVTHVYDILKKYNIINYHIIEVNYFDIINHGNVIMYATKYISDENYNTYIDEDDSYILNDTFNDFFSKLDTFDIIGAKKMEYQINIFGKKMYTLHLPQFLSKNIHEYNLDWYMWPCVIDREGNVNKNLDNWWDIDYIPLDTFQYINFQIARSSNNVFLYEYSDWCVSDDFYEFGKSDLKSKVLYHMFNSRLFANVINDIKLKKDNLHINERITDTTNLNSELKIIFLYECVKSIGDFLDKDIYDISLSHAYAQIHNKFEIKELVDNIL